MRCKLLLFDLDGTLLRTDKTISKITMQKLERCRERGIMIGVSTSRSEKNSMGFITELNPDVVISSAGALVKYRGRYIYQAEFTKEETKGLIQKTREVCGENCEITIDTVNDHYWNYKTDPKQQDRSWGDSIYTDFCDFDHASLKMCVEIFDERVAEKLQQNLPECDCVRFSDGYWYKFTKKTATKENAILHMCKECGITTDDIVAFGDDYADIGMLKLCGIGVAMGNPQCYAAVADRMQKFDNKVLVVEIGSWTVDIMPIINHKPDESVCVTKPSGFITCIQQINKECVRQIGAEVDEYDIQRLLTSGGADLPDEYRKIIEKEIRAYCQQVYHHIRELGYNMDLTPVIFVGGGAGVMKQYGGLLQKNITYVEDICANAKGYEMLGNTYLKAVLQRRAG